MADNATRGARNESGDLTSVELFAGAGGLALGLCRGGGFRPALVVDSDKTSIDTLRANESGHTHGWNVKLADVRTLSYQQLGLGQIDLVSAGAPCQPFSVGGQLRGEDDDRNMFPEVIRAVRELEPRAFVFENVRGLLFERVREYFNYILAQLRAPSCERRPDQEWRDHLRALTALPESRHEYVVDWRVLNAADFGLAQNRQRLVVVGTHVDEATFVWPKETHCRDELIAALRGNDYWEEHALNQRIRDLSRARLPKVKIEESDRKRWRTLRDLTVELGPPHDDTGDDPQHRLVQGARLYKKHTGSRLDWPAKTVKAGVHGSPGGEHILVADDGSHRYLTVRECAALQGFDGDYVLPGKRRPAMRQLGNAVPVALAEAVGAEVRKVLAA